MLTDSAESHPRGHWHASAIGWCAGDLVTTRGWGSLAQQGEAMLPLATQCPAQVRPFRKAQGERMWLKG